MNIYDVSKQAGVSIATVSRVLNNSAGVSEKTRDRVLAVMQQSGYQPNAFARGLGLNSMKTIGLLCSDFSDPFLAQAIAHLEKMLRNCGYDCLLCCTGYSQAVRERDLKLLITRRVDGLIFVGSNYVSLNEEENQYILSAAKRLPVMMLNGMLSGENVYCTLCDDEQASYIATEKLIHSGCRELLYLYHMQSYGCARKLSGFTRAVVAHELSMQTQLTPIATARTALSDLYLSGTKFDGVFCADDALGVAVLKYATANNRAVPDDLCVIGYNNSMISSCCEPELTTIDNKLEALCGHTVSTLMGVLDGQNMPTTTIFNAELIERGTTR